MDAPSEDDINNNPYILSKTQPMGEHSFIDKRQEYNNIAPPPKYFDDEFLMKNFGNLPTEKDVILHGFEVPDAGGLICTDEEALNK